MSHCQHTALIWPSPTEGLDYIHWSSGPDDYVSTGQFPAGARRTIEECAQLTSLFFDADVVELFNAERREAGQPLEKKKAQQKAALWAQPAADVQDYKNGIQQNMVEVLTELIGAPPTLVLDSGWGIHVHYAYAGPHDASVLQPQVAAIIAAANDMLRARISPFWERPLDATHDLGARVARQPGSTNNKCAAQPRPVVVLDSDPTTVLDAARVAAIAAALPQPAPPPQTRARSARAPKTPRAPRSAPASGYTRLPADFANHTIVLDDGNTYTWQAVVETMAALGSTRMDVVCPYQGTSVGSAFFVVEENRSRLVSTASNTTYLNTRKLPPPNGRRYAEFPEAQQRRESIRQPDGSTVSVPMGPQSPLPTMANLLQILNEDSTFDLWHDSFRQVIMDGTTRLPDEAHVAVTVVLEDDYGWTGPKSKDHLWGALAAVANQRAQNPVQDYLRGLKWDGQPRIDTWLDTVVYAPGRAAGAECSPPPDKLLRAYSRRWVIGLVARALEPGCKLDTVLVLRGAQGARKSSMWACWMPTRDLFADSPIDVRNAKAAAEQLHACWLYEDAELAGGRAADENSKKRFLSSACDTYRAAYARSAKPFPRHSVIVGSSNDDAILKDPTGSRRYWIVDCPFIPHLPRRHPDQPHLDREYVAAHRDQLLAEAVVAYSAGEIWHLEADEDYLSELDAQRHVAGGAWQDLADVVFAANCGGEDNAITLTDFALAAQPDLETTDLAKMMMTLAGALIGAGFCKGKKHPRNRRAQYYKPVAPGVTPMTGDGLDAIRQAATGGNFRFNGDSFRS